MDVGSVGSAGSDQWVPGPVGGKVDGREGQVREEVGGNSQREVGGWGEIHTRQLRRQRDGAQARCAWPAWGDRDREKKLGGKRYKKQIEVCLQKRMEGKWAGCWLHIGLKK